MLLTYGTDVRNPVKNLTGASLGRMCQKGPDAGPAGAEIRYIPSYIHVAYMLSTPCYINTKQHNTSRC